MRFLFSILLVFMAVICLGQRTTRPRLRLREDVRVERAENSTDTIVPAKGEIAVSGFEKAQQSATECFFVTNHTSRTITALTFTLNYYNLRGERLHARTETVSCDIPSSDTRKIDLRSWDRQKLWYYVKSQARHNANSTPFDVSIHIHSYISPKE